MTACPAPTGDFPFQPEGLDRLDMRRYRIRFNARERVVAPAARLPNMVRGTFEMSFRRLVCHDVSLDCARCPLLNQCPYPAVFRPSPPTGSDRLSGYQDLPRPFLFEPPSNLAETLEPGQALEIGLTLFGHTARLLPYFVVALRALAERGLGVTRGRLDLREVTALTPSGVRQVFEESAATVTAATEPLRLGNLLRPSDESTRRITVRFLTPTTLKRDGRLVERPSFADVACRTRDRLSSLAAFFGDGPIEMDFAGVRAAAENIRTVACGTSWATRTRRSSRTGRVHETSGFVGEVAYEGDLGAWMPLLRVGEVIHVGKYAVWGNGRLQVGTT